MDKSKFKVKLLPIKKMFFFMLEISPKITRCIDIYYCIIYFIKKIMIKI